MATQKQVDDMLELLKDSDPAPVLKKMNETTAGIGAVLRFLYDNDAPATAGQLSRIINVSTARTAVLLRKMEAKNLIIKSTDEKDARITIVTLSPDGHKMAEAMQAEIRRQVNDIIDKIGTERLTNYINTTKEIYSVIKFPDIDIT